MAGKLCGSIHHERDSCMVDMKNGLKCGKCGYTLKEQSKCPRCGTVAQCSLSCPGNCLKCFAEAAKANKQKLVDKNAE